MSHHPSLHTSPSSYHYFAILIMTITITSLPHLLHHFPRRQMFQHMLEYLQVLEAVLVTGLQHGLLVPLVLQLDCDIVMVDR